MRISDWSSDVCSSDLVVPALRAPARQGFLAREHDLAEKLGRVGHVEIELCGAKIAGPGIQDIVVDSIGLAIAVGDVTRADIAAEINALVSVVIADRILAADIQVTRTTGVSGKRVPVRLDPGGCRYLKKKK